MLRLYKGQKVSRLSAIRISLQKSRFTKQRKTRFITNMATPYYELQINPLEMSPIFATFPFEILISLNVAMNYGTYSLFSDLTIVATVELVSAWARP